MRNYRAILAPALLFAVFASSGAHAAGIASGLLYFSSNQDRLICYVSNIGNAPAVISKTTLLRANGTTLAPLSDTCTGTLAAGKSCVFYATGIGATPGLCSLTTATAGQAKNLRGTASLSDNLGNTLLQQDMR